MCQDTGTAIIMGKKGRRVWTEGGDYAALANGVMDAYEKKNLRYSQLAPLKMFEEKNTKNNLPAQIDIYEEGTDAYEFLFVAKGGGSANKTFLYQGTPSLSDARSHAGVPQGKDPDARHGGLSALSSRHRHRRHLGRDEPEDRQARLDALSRQPADRRLRSGHAFRDVEMEKEIHKLTQQPRRRRAVRRQVFLS